MSDPSVLGSIFWPAIVTWNRLEPRPRTESFERSLRAEIRDPLWMLCRQWQVGEFRGDDAGTALKARVVVETVRLNRFARRDHEAVPYDDRVPLETMVEREPIPMDLSIRALVGRHFFKLLTGQTTSDLRALYLGEYPFAEPTAPLALAHLRSDQAAWQTMRLLMGRAVDGELLLRAIESGDHAAFVAAAPLSATDRDAALAAAEQLVDWFGRVFSQPQSAEEDAWAPSYFEYQATCMADSSAGPAASTALDADEYHGGRLDWYSFDIREVQAGDGRVERATDGVGDSPPQVADPIAFVPTAIEFGGMPNARWWELEDQQTDLGSLHAGTTDLAMLMLAEFGLIYGNDWSLLPYDLDVGSLARITGIVVTDTFGQQTFIRPAGRQAGDDWQRWGMYHLSDDDDRPDSRLLLPPVVAKALEGDPLERVVLARDEMANMVWGVESVIPGVRGDGWSGDEAAAALRAHLAANQPSTSPADGIETQARIRWMLGTTVPENWIPFIAVHQPGSNRQIRLQRATLPRVVTGDPSDVVEPRGEVLRPGLEQGQPYFVHEEEVPRAGAVVTRSFQRARWWDGRVYTWLGRRRKTGLGQGGSGLGFDRIDSTGVG